MKGWIEGCRDERRGRRRLGGDEEGVEGTRAAMTGGPGLVLSLPLRSLMEAVLSKLCRFIRGLVSDNFELSVIEKTPSHLHVHAHADK